ncbi:MAG: YdiU family protein, partial [Anaerolineae bacterium]|nr:YdiU family protein [Anaerolineae bacterium]
MTYGFKFDNSYAEQLDGFYVLWQATPAPKPALVKLNRALAHELNLDAEALMGEAGAAIFSGNVTPTGAKPLAQAYAGHQFGGFSPQLGDGRALLLGEVIDRNGQRRDLQFKGSGRTPFSRGGDGKAAIGPMLREYIIGEAMHALGIRSTRALAVVSTGAPVQRETRLPGAVLTRVAASHIRVGTFQFFAARGDIDKVRRLADYTITRHYPALRDAANPYLALLQTVSEAQAALVARWMLVGFIHGVMNTDNMAISGETIDYGPCAFMDHYEPNTVFSSIDTHGRYAYINQPGIARWNLARFAETLLPLISDNDDQAVKLATDVINQFTEHYGRHWLSGMRAKLGLAEAEAGDAALVNDLLAILQAQGADYTLSFRHLAEAALGDADAVWAQIGESGRFAQWLVQGRARFGRETLTATARAEAMNRVNPLYIPRNHKVEQALDAATTRQDYAPFEALLDALS